MKAYVDDAHVSCSVDNVGPVIAAFGQATEEQGMTLNKCKLKIWGVPKGLLATEQQCLHVDVLPLLGNTARSDGRLHVAPLGDRFGAF